MPVIIYHSQRKSLQIACFTQPTVQNPKLFSLLIYEAKQAAGRNTDKEMFGIFFENDS